MRKIKKLILISISLYTAYCILHTPAHAQTFSLGIYPPILEVMIKPGKTITQAYKVKNSGDDLVLIPNIVSFNPKDELGNVYLTRLNPVTKNWFSLTNANIQLDQPFSLPSGTSQQLVLKIKIPENAIESDHYFSLTLTTSPTPLIGMTKTGMKGVIASNILLTISEDGTPQRKAEISKFSSKKLLDSFDKPAFDVQIRNIGQAYLQPQGSISIYNTIGKKIANLELLPENVLVNAIRKINCRADDADDKVRPCQWDPGFLIGRYQTKLDFQVDAENYQAEIIFYAFPIKLSLALLLTGAILIIILKRRR